MISTPHHYLKVVSSEQPLGVRKARRMHLPRMGKEVRSL